MIDIFTVLKEFLTAFFKKNKNFKINNLEKIKT